MTLVIYYTMSFHKNTKRFGSQAWARILIQIGRYEKILARQPIKICEDKEIKKENDKIDANVVKEVNVQRKDKKDKKDNQVKRRSNTEIADKAITKISYDGALKTGVHDTTEKNLVKTPDSLLLGAPSVCVKLLTDSFLSALIYEQQEAKKKFNESKIIWEVRKKNGHDKNGIANTKQFFI